MGNVTITCSSGRLSNAINVDRVLTGSLLDASLSLRSITVCFPPRNHQTALFTWSGVAEDGESLPFRPFLPHHKSSDDVGQRYAVRIIFVYASSLQPA